MARHRYIYKGGKVIAEFHNGDLVHAEPEYFGEAEQGPLIVPDLPGYVSPVTGLWVEGRRARREDLKRTGSRPYEGREQEVKESMRRRAYDEARLAERIERTTHETWNHLPRATQRKLMGEQ